MISATSRLWRVRHLDPSSGSVTCALAPCPFETAISSVLPRAGPARSHPVAPVNENRHAPWSLFLAGPFFTERGVKFRKWPARPYVPTGIKNKRTKK
jgi:hypothetical protein